MDWQSIETAPKHTDILLFRADAGVFLGQFTYCADWVDEEEAEREGVTEEVLFREDFWAFDYDGASRLENELRPTHWMPLPDPPAEAQKAA